MASVPLTRSLLLFGALAIAACATSGGTTEDGTGTVSGGGRSDSGGGLGGDAGYGSDDGSTASDAGMMMMGDSSIVITDSGTHDTGASDTGPVDSGGHSECPTTLAYATEAAMADPMVATACTMGGPECLANVECCFADLCVQYPAP